MHPEMQNLSCSGSSYKGDCLEVDGHMHATPLSVMEPMVSMVL